MQRSISWPKAPPQVRSGDDAASGHLLTPVSSMQANDFSHSNECEAVGAAIYKLMRT